MPTETDELTIAKRRLILRDSLSFLSLLMVTILLFAVTLFLFRSFSSHRADLAQRWSSRGEQALKNNQPQQAIVDLRTALTYSPGTRNYEILLAQALGQAGHTEESYQYFMGLWQERPGDGSINLQLARLAAKKNDHQTAVNFYRAAIYGTWEGDGVERRSEIRLELARYLIDTRNASAARMELLIAAGNAPDTFDFDMTLGHLLEQASDPADAWTYYQKAIADKPGEPTALEAAARLAYASGDYRNAYHLLVRSLADRAARHLPPLAAADNTLLTNSQRILDLTPARSLSPRQRVQRILADRAIAKSRLQACSDQLPPALPLPASLQTLTQRWSTPDGTAQASALLSDAALQDSAMQLVYDTETATAKLCNAPTGDDALLLLLANSSQAAVASDISAPGVAQRE